MKLNFSMVVQFIKKLFGSGIEVYILDCTCSGVYDIDGNQRTSPKTVNRLNKSMLSIFKTPKNVTRKSTSLISKKKSASPKSEKVLSLAREKRHELNIRNSRVCKNAETMNECINMRV